MNVSQGDRRPGAARAPRSCTPASTTCTPPGHAKQEELKTLLSIVRARVVRARCTASTATSWPTPSWPQHDGRAGRRTCSSARTATSSRSTTTASRVSGQVPAGYLYVDGIVGDVGHGVLRDRRVLAEEGVVVVVVTVDVEDRRHPHRPRDHHPGLGLRPRGRGAARRVRRRGAPGGQGGVRRRDATDIETLQRHVRRAAGRFVNDRTKRRPMIVPVVMSL